MNYVGNTELMFGYPFQRGAKGLEDFARAATSHRQRFIVIIVSFPMHAKNVII